MIVYITGPTDNLENDNLTEFQSFKNIVKGFDHHAVIPHDLIKTLDTKDFESTEYLKEGLKNLLDADMVITLSNWHNSKRAVTEVNTARVADIEVVHFTQFKYHLSCLQ